MPQMSPLLWLILYVYFIILFIFMNMMMYYFFFNYKNLEKKIKSNLMFKMKWFW